MKGTRSAAQSQDAKETCTARLFCAPDFLFFLAQEEVTFAKIVHATKCENFSWFMSTRRGPKVNKCDRGDRQSSITLVESLTFLQP